MVECVPLRVPSAYPTVFFEETSPPVPKPVACPSPNQNMQDGNAGPGNISEAPGFVGVSDYHLAAGSACIDTGTANNAPDHDLAGQSRPYGAGYDMGAYEYHE